MLLCSVHIKFNVSYVRPYSYSTLKWGFYVLSVSVKICEIESGTWKKTWIISGLNREDVIGEELAKCHITYTAIITTKQQNSLSIRRPTIPSTCKVLPLIYAIKYKRDAMLNTCSIRYELSGILTLSFTLIYRTYCVLCNWNKTFLSVFIITLTLTLKV